MNQNLLKIKKETENKFLNLRIKRKSLVARFKKRLENEKINQIKNSVLDK